MGIDFVDDIVEDVVDIHVDIVEDFVIDPIVDFATEGLASLFEIDLPEQEAALEGALVTKTGAVQFLPLVCGTRRTGGTLIFAEVTGASNEYLWLVYALADGDVPISKISNDATDGKITVDGLPLDDAKYTGLYTLESTAGGHTSQPFTALDSEATNWNSTHKLLGTVAQAVRFKWDKEAFSGLPRITFPLVGTELLDLDVLPTETRRRSNNPAEFLFEYLINDIVGKGLSKVDGVDIDIQSFKDARDYCNDSITSYFGGPSHTRMECNLVIDPARTIKQNITTILQTCRGSLPYINGVFHLVIEKHYVPADYGRANYFDFNVDNIIGSWSFKSGDINARYNRVKVTFANEDLDYKSDFVAVESSTFRAEDGRLLEKAISLPGTTNVYRAIDTASVLMRKSRQQILASFLATPEGRQVTVGEIVTVTHPTPGWTAKQFRVTRLTLLRSGNCSVTLSEHEETVYDLQVPNEVNTAADTNLPDPSLVPAVTGLTLLSDETVLKIAGDGTLVPQIKVTWTVPSNIFVNGYDVEFKLSADSIWQTAGTPNSIATDELFIPNVTETVDYDVRARARNSVGFSGAWATVVDHTVIGKTSDPADVTGFIALQRAEVVVFRWNQVVDRDLGGYDIRYAPQGSTVWADATTLTKATRGTNVTSADVIPGNWTFMIKAIDTSKNESVNVATSDILVSNEQIVIAQQSSAPDWPGTLTGFSKHWTGKLVPNSTSNNAAIGWRVFDEFVPDPVATATYESLEIDVDFDDTLRVWGEITSALGFGEVGQANPALEIDYKLEAGAYGGFSLWSGGQANFRYVKAKLTLTTAEGVAYISDFNVTVDAAERIQRVEDITVAASGTAIVFPQRYHTPPFVQPYYVGSAVLIPGLGGDAVTGAGFTLHLYDTANADVGGTGGAYQASGG